MRFHDVRADHIFCIPLGRVFANNIGNSLFELYLESAQNVHAPKKEDVVQTVAMFPHMEAHRTYGALSHEPLGQ